MPRYLGEGKITVPLSDQDFLEGMEKGIFVKGDLHKAYNALLFYTGVNKSEARETKKEQFTVIGGYLVYDVGKRKRSNRTTDSLKIPINYPYVDVICKVIEATEPGSYVFPFSDKTAYNVVRRVFNYPLFYRFSRIQNFYNRDIPLNQIKNWTGLTSTALNAYEPETNKEKTFNDILDFKPASK